MTADSSKSGSSSQSDRSKSSSRSGSGDVFDIERIRQIVELMKQHELSEVDLQQSEDRIRLTRGSSQPTTFAPPAYAPPPVPVPAAPATAPVTSVPAPGTITINSPMVGTFYARANPESPAFVKVGDRVSEDTVVCIIEAMKVFNEIPAECSGKVVEVLIGDQESVDFGKPLFRIQTGG